MPDEARRKLAYAAAAAGAPGRAATAGKRPPLQETNANLHGGVTGSSRILVTHTVVKTKPEPAPPRERSQSRDRRASAESTGYTRTLTKEEVKLALAGSNQQSEVGFRRVRSQWRGRWSACASI